MRIKETLGAAVLSALMLAPLPTSAQTAATSSASILQQVISLQQLISSLQQQINQLEAQINTLTNGSSALSQPLPATGTSSSLPNIFAPVQSAGSDDSSVATGGSLAAQNLLLALQSPSGYVAPTPASTTPAAAATTTTTSQNAAPASNGSMCPMGQTWLYGFCNSTTSL